MKKALIITVVTAILCITVFATGCGSTKISDILANPNKYADKEVVVSGTVTEKYWVQLLGLKTGAYQIDDGSGKIWVLTKQEPPSEGQKTSAKGTVSIAGKIGDRSFGNVINEVVKK